MLHQILPMILVCLIGYGLKQAGVLRPEDTKTIGKLLTNLALPALILKALATTSITPDLIYLPLSALVVVLGLTLIGALCLRGLKLGRATAGVLVTAFPTLEAGALGYPLMLIAFGDVGLSRIVLFDLAHAIYLLTVVYCLSAWFGKADITAQMLVSKLVKTPFFWAIILGLGLNGLGLNGGMLLNLLDIVGGSFLLLVLLLLGLEFQINISALGLCLLLAVIKMGCGLGLGWLVAGAFGLDGVERAAVLVGSTLPPSLLTLLFAQENHLDTGFAVSLISVAIPLSLVVLPLIISLSQ
ncbi:MAG: AEC family transporter [Cyanobacteria bacterium Co-bin8]|nr:AEC family transporter [Cyanobacteria bacterium Co-bin8]